MIPLAAFEDVIDASGVRAADRGHAAHRGAAPGS